MLDTSDANKPEYISALAALLQQEGVRIEKVLLSHWHHDHVGGAPSIAAHPTLPAEGVKHKTSKILFYSPLCNHKVRKMTL